MSGLVKGVKKVFKKVANFVKKYWKYIVIAVAVYFTAGVALSYFGSTAAFASSMPGFGVGGMFSKAAVWMGFNGSASVASGLSMTSGVFGAGTAAAGAIVPAGTTAAEAAGVLGEVGTTATAIPAGGTVAGAQASSAAKLAATEVAKDAAITAAAPTATDALIKAMTTQSKLAMVKMGLDTVSGLMAPDPYEEARKMHALQNAASFGVGRDGNADYGWGKVGTGSAFQNMNKRNPIGSTQASSFRDQEFLPTDMETQSQGQFAQMPEPPPMNRGLPETDFIRQGGPGPNQQQLGPLAVGGQYG